MGAAPRTLDRYERRTFSLLYRILAEVTKDEDEREYSQRARNVLSEGHTGLYELAFRDLYDEIPYADCQLVWDILDMFRVLLGSWRALKTDEPMPDGLRFQGFDLNDPREAAMLGFATSLIEDSKYSEQQDRFGAEFAHGNSLSENLEMYQRMLTVFKPIWQSRVRGGGGYHLTADEMDQIRVAARP